MPVVERRLHLHELPAAVEELDGLLQDLEDWELQPTETDRIEHEALEAHVQARLAELAEQLPQLGEATHHWLTRLRAEHEEAKAELRRVQRFESVRWNKLQRVKEWVTYCLSASGLQRLEGSSWRLRLQANGGRLALQPDSTSLIPVNVAKPVQVSPADLVLRLKDLLGDAHFSWTSADDHVLLARLGILELEPDGAKAWAWAEAHGGELPPGLEALPRGQHLRVE